MRRLAILAALALAGCATPAHVAVSCIPKDYPAPGAYSDTADRLKAAPDFAVRYQLLAGNWFARDARLQSDEALIANCR